MGQVIPFIARVRDSGDWTETERARLEELADRLSAAGIRVDVAFGTTDEGDPWCAVTDETGDVLIHVARIGGTFVVHSAFDDSLNEGADLHDALRDQLHAAADWAEPAQPSAEILPFEARRAQTFLALIAAAAFIHEAVGPAPAHAAEVAPPSDLPHEPVAPPVLPAAEDREVTIHGAAVSQPTHTDAAVALTPTTEAVPIVEAAPEAPTEPQPAPAASPAPEAQPAETPAPAAPATSNEPAPQICGTDGDDLLVGTTQSEVLLGGAGNDTLDGGGGHDTLDGGAGDDHIVLGANVVAIGGSGADTFVIRARPVADHPDPDQLLGQIFDFNALAGDRVTNWRGDHVTLPPHVGDGTTPPDGHDVAGASGFTTTTRVDVDLDGDGKLDGYLLVGHDGRPPAPPVETPPTDDPPITASVGHSLGWHEPGT